MSNYSTVAVFMLLSSYCCNICFYLLLLSYPTYSNYHKHYLLHKLVYFLPNIYENTLLFFYVILSCLKVYNYTSNQR